MRLIIEQVRALMTGLFFSSVKVQSPQEKLKSFLQWCQENEVLVKELTIPTREERSAR